MTENNRAIQNQTATIRLDYVIMILLGLIACVLGGLWKYENTLKNKANQELAVFRKAQREQQRGAAMLQSFAAQTAKEDPIKPGTREMTVEGKKTQVKTLPANFVKDLGLKEGDITLIVKPKKLSKEEEAKREKEMSDLIDQINKTKKPGSALPGNLR